MNLEDKLYTVGSKPDESGSHLAIRDPKPCLEECGPRGRPCTTFCPARVYVWEADRITVAYNNCLECTACRTGCPFANIDCRYPRGGFGVAHKYG